MKTKQTGMTLIELMVALAIGMFLMLGAITVFMQSRTTFRLTESIARMQENARVALEIMEPDIRMAHYWGLTTTTTNIANRAGPAGANGPGPDNCGNNFTINFDQAVSGGNNAYNFACVSATWPAQANADTLAVRRVSEDPVVPTAGGLHLQSRRGTGNSQVFVGAGIPAGFAVATSATFRVIANGYYVSRASSIGANVPSLRFWTLQDTGVMSPSQELVAGIEDMQVQFGIDTDLPGQADRGSIDRYVNPNDPLVEPFNPASNVEILAVRIWLRVRAERPEQGFRDTVNYVYADQNVGPFNDNFRRLVVSKTIYLRNARPNS